MRRDDETRGRKRLFPAVRCPQCLGVDCLVQRTGPPIVTSAGPVRVRWMKCRSCGTAFKHVPAIGLARAH